MKAPKPLTVSALEFRAALAAAGLLQAGFARLLFDYNPDITLAAHARRVRALACGERPPTASTLLALALLRRGTGANSPNQIN